MKLLITLLLLLMPIFSPAGGGTEIYADWQLSNEGCCGCSSFYWKVDRTFNYNTGVYEFGLWFASNAFRIDCVPSSIYIYGIKFYLDGKLTSDPVWVYTFDPFKPLTISYNQPFPTLFLTWEGQMVK